jgi:sugar/nucleoside kinase (ribokinase family)
MDLSSKRIMVAGHICLDIAPKFRPGSVGGIEEILVPGKLVNIDEAVLCTGGTVSNTGLSLAKLGADVVLNGKVGNDQFGRIIKECVGTQRASAFKTVEHQNTSYTVILAVPGVDRIFLHNPGTNDTFVADDIDYDAAQSCMLFHFGYPPLMKRMFANDGAELIEMFRRVRSMGVTTSLDMSLPDPASESGKANWAKILSNLHAYRTADYQQLSDMLLDMGVKMAAMKSGIRGYYLKTSDKISDCGKAAPKDVRSWSGRELWCASFKATQFGSATGAGDATIAGFIAGLVAGFGPEKSLRIANTVGWENVRAIDALSGIEDWAATLRYVDDVSRSQNDPGLDDTWNYDPAMMVYRGTRDGKI